MRRLLDRIRALCSASCKDSWLTALVEMAPDCIQVLNPDGTRRFINQAGLRMLGANSAAAIAHCPAWEFVAAQDRPRVKVWFKQLLSGKPGQIELCLEGLDGRRCHVESRGVPLRDRSGRIDGALIITRDITEYRLACQELAKLSRLYRMLSQINHLILRRPGRKALLEHIAKIILQEGGFASVLIGLSDARGHLQHQVFLTPEPCADTARLAEQMLSQNLPLVANTPAAIEDAALRAEISRCQIKALALLPIRVRGQVAGVLGVCAQEEGFFELESLKLLEELSADIGFSLEFEAISVERKLQEKELEFLAYHDPLTSLPNRRRLLEHLSLTIAHARRQGTGFALMLLDLDRFKDVNDSFGHHLGDRLLVQVSTLLSQRLRASDFLARLGGDEFALVLDNLHTPEDAGQVAAELIANLNQPWRLSKEIEVQIGASVGIAVYPDHGQDPNTLIQDADAALYQAKAQGRGQFCYYSPELTERTRYRLHLTNRLREALQDNQLALYFQPQCDRDGRLVGAEALVRWQHQGKPIPPAEFIPVAEQTGLIASLDTWVLSTLCRQGRTWLDKGFSIPVLAANLSPREFHRRQLDQVVAKILRETGFPADLLELELTESAFMEHTQKAADMLKKLRTLGIYLALDDFGTGYSSLAQLKRFPFSRIKIDKSFVNDLPGLKEDCEIASAIIAMSHTLGIQVVAEGVETQAQFQFLAEQGCDFYQGYFYDPPLPAEEFAKRWLEPLRGEQSACLSSPPSQEHQERTKPY